jgi:hypothetical protein
MSQVWLKIGADAPKAAEISGELVSVVASKFIPAEWRALGDVLAQEWVSQYVEEQTFVRHQSAVQTELVRRRRGTSIGEDFVTSTNPVVPTAVAASPRPKLTRPKAGQRKPRPKLAQMVDRAWRTQEGQRMLVGHTMRGLGQHFGVSHTSFYEVPFFVAKILPLRQRGLRGQQANAWRERSGRNR